EPPPPTPARSGPASTALRRSMPSWSTDSPYTPGRSMPSMGGRSGSEPVATTSTSHGSSTNRGGAGADLDVLLTELLGGAGDQVVPVLDDVGGVVGEPAGRIGGVPSPLEGDDLQLLRLAPAARLRVPPAPPRVAH